MTASRVRWALFAALYAAFYFWYGGSTDPISPQEAEQYVARFIERATEQGVDPGIPNETNVDIGANLIQFMAEDDGQEFVMLNLNVYRDAPAYEEGVDGSDAIESAAAAEDEYQRRIAPLLLKRACHPIAAVEPAVLIGGIGDFERQDWSYASMVRYRSRLDFIEFILEPAFARDVNHKWAALDRSSGMATVPVTNWASIRLVPLLILVVLGLVLDRIGARKRAA